MGIYNLVYKKTNIIETSGYLEKRILPNGTTDIHQGVDFDNGDGSSLYAVCDATIVQSGWDNACGNYVAYTDGTYTYYVFHMKFAPTLNVGQSIVKGAEIGKQGNTGNSFGSHCHFEVRNSAGTPIDPMPFCEVQETSVTASNKDTIVAFLHSNGNRYYLYIKNQQDDLRHATKELVQYPHIVMLANRRTFYLTRSNDILETPAGNIEQGSSIACHAVWRA